MHVKRQLKDIQNHIFDLKDQENQEWRLFFTDNELSLVNKDDKYVVYYLIGQNFPFGKYFKDYFKVL